MKLIIAIVRPHTIEKSSSHSKTSRIPPGITVTDVEGFGKRLRTPGYDKLDPFKHKKQIEIAANDDMVEQIVSALRTHAHTGKVGDGIIVVLPIEEAFLI